MVAFGQEPAMDLVEEFSEERIHRLYMEFFNFPERKEEILSEIEYLKIINSPYFKTKTPEIEKGIKFFSKFQADYIKEWFRTILDIQLSSTSILEKVYVMHDKRLYEIRKDGIVRNYYQHYEIRLLPLNKIKTAILDGNYKPTKKEIEFHIWGNEGSQFITNKVLEKLTGSRDIRRLSLSKKNNLERLSTILHEVFLQVEKYFEENVEQNESAFLDYELFLKLLKASIQTKKVDQAKYWFRLARQDYKEE